MIGLYAEYYSPFPKGGIYLGRIERFSSYSHELNAIGGMISCTISFAVSHPEAEEWYENGLGRVIKVNDEAGMCCFYGMVNQITLNAGGLNEVIGPLFDIANRVSGVYTPRDFSVYPPVDGTQTVTLIAEDSDSQNEYGIIEKVITIGTTTEENANKIRDVFLNENKYPKTSGDLALSTNALQYTSISLDVVGLYEWLKHYVYNDNSTDVDYLSEKIIDILQADPNSFISTDYSYIQSNSYLTPLAETKNRYAWDILQELINLGNDTTDDRRVIGIYEDGKVVYELPDKTITYYHRLSDNIQGIFTVGGSLVRPWLVRPAKWIHLTDFIPGRFVDAPSFDDPRNKFIERVSYSAPYSVTLGGGVRDLVNQMIAKITYSGGLL